MNDVEWKAITGAFHPHFHQWIQGLCRDSQQADQAVRMLITIALDMQKAFQ